MPSEVTFAFNCLSHLYSMLFQCSGRYCFMCVFIACYFSAVGLIAFCLSGWLKGSSVRSVRSPLCQYPVPASDWHTYPRWPSWLSPWHFIFFFFIVFFFVCLSVFLVQHRKPTRQSVLLLNWASALLLAIRVDGDQGKWCLQELVVWGLVAQYTHPFIARLFVSFTRKYMRSLFLSERNEWGFYTILVLFSCYGSQGFSLDSAR